MADHPSDSEESESDKNGSSFDPPTEEQFALGARIPDQFTEADLLAGADEGGEVPELDPSLREALGDVGGPGGAASGEGDAEPLGEPPREHPETEEHPATEEHPVTPGHPETGEHPAIEEHRAGGAEESAGVEAGASLEYDEVHPDVTGEHTVIIDAARTEVHQALALASETGVPWSPSLPPAAGDPEKAPRRPHLFLRFLLAALLVICSVAAATSASIILYLDDIAAELSKGSLALGKEIVPPRSGAAQTILILGSDKRASISAKGDRGLSDTVILLRLDPRRDAIAMFSIPRDLKVNIPGYGVNKFNAAYSYGGPKLTLKVIRNITGGLEVNHVVNIDFLGFVKAVDELGGVFINVDRRYYHSNEGLPAAEQYDEIDIQPGYQKLFGEDALSYVRYRHTDTDLVRSARQQAFLQQARAGVPFSTLFSDRDNLLKIFTTYTTSDIHKVSEVVDLLNLLIDARSAKIKEVHFPATLGASYVTATKAEIKKATTQFLGIQNSNGPRGTLELPDSGQKSVKSSKGADKGGSKQKPKPKPKPQPSPTKSVSDGLVDASGGSREVALQAAGQLGPRFPVYYPTRLPEGTIYAQEPRVYYLRDNDKKTHGAYVMVLQLAAMGDYFNVQGIRNWEDPPILSGPHETLRKNGRDYSVYYDGDRIRMVAWHRGRNTYWIANSLLLTLTNDQIISMAQTAGIKIPKRKKNK